MKSLVWSFVERVLPRAASALIVLFLAAVLPPSVVGLYSAVMVAVTLMQAISDGAVRQIAVSAIDSVEGRRFLRNYSVATASFGGLFIASICFVVASSNADIAAQGLSLLPLALIPAVTSARVKPLAVIQSAGRWASLARIQLIASAVSFAVSVGILFLTQSLVAAAVQGLMTESAFTLLVWLMAKRISLPNVSGSGAKTTGFGREFLHLSLYAALAWLQSQADRVLLLGIAGTGTLGLYSLSWSISRAGSDALAASTANVARPILLRDHDERAFARTLERALYAQAAIWTLTVAGTVFVVAPILGPPWAAAVAAVPVLALSGFASVVEWSATVAMVKNARIRWAAPIKAAGVVLAIPIALIAVNDLWLASWWVVGRECVVMILMGLATRGPVGRASAMAMALTVAGGVIALLMH